MCHGLTTGEKYVFKVKAVNAAGYSNSSPLSDPVLVKAAVCEFTLELVNHNLHSFFSVFLHFL